MGIAPRAPLQAGMPTIDLKHLAIIDELCRTRSVTEAAERLGVSQPAISVSLAKLRRHFGDPFFVRTSDGMLPTPLALEVIQKLGHAYDTIHEVLGHHVAFDPRVSSPVLNVCAGDIIEAIALPSLLQELQVTAPNVRLEIWSASSEIARLLETGKLDVAIGLTPKLGAGFFQQKLYTERYVCIVHSEHPRIKTKITSKHYREESHAVVSIPGLGQGHLGPVLRAKNIRRRIGVYTHNWLGLSYIVSNTDYVASVPERLGRVFAGAGNIRVLPLPFEAPPLIIKQYWHQRYTKDAGSVWLRRMLKNLFRSNRA